MTKPNVDMVVDRIIKTITSDFLQALMCAMSKGPANRTVKLDSRRHIVYWLDGDGQLNYAGVHPYMAPTARRRTQPLVMRIVVNCALLGDGEPERLIKRAGWVKHSRTLRGDTGASPSTHCRMELSVLPDQLIGFVSWVEGLVRAHEMNDASLVPGAPYPLCSLYGGASKPTYEYLLCSSYEWSITAWDCATKYNDARRKQG